MSAATYSPSNVMAPRPWAYRQLAEVADILDSRRVPINSKERDGRHGAIPYYGATGQVGWIDDWIFEEELVLLGEDGAPFLDPRKAKAYAIRGKSWVNNHAHVLRAREVPTGWLLHALNAVDYGELVTGTTRLKLTQAEMRKIRIPVAPMHVMQEVVAEVEKQFSRLDEAVANLQCVKAKLLHYELSVLRAALGGVLVPTEAALSRVNGRRYESGQALLERIAKEDSARGSRRKATDASATPDHAVLPTLPEGWTWARLAAIASIKGGITVDSKRTDPTSRLVPYLRVANVQRGYLDLGELKSINAPAADIDALRLRHGDVLFNEGGDRDKLGRGWIWEGQLPECIHQNHVFRARPHSLDISSKLISWWGNTFGKDYFQREGKQTTNLASINMTKLSAFPVPIPPAAEQRRIVAEVDRRLSIVGEVEAEVDANLKRAQALRQAVLARAFGERAVERPVPIASRPTLLLVPGTTTLIDAARAAVAAEVVHRLHAEPTFGQTKHQKIVYLAEHIARIDNMQVVYRRAQRGPLNLQVIEANERILEQCGWYVHRRREGSSGHRYVPMTKAGEHAPYLAVLSSEQLDRLRELIELMRCWDTDRCERFATIYAAWNDLILVGKLVSDEAVLREVFELWDQSKLRFKRAQWLETLRWIEKSGYAPTGYGQLTRSAIAGITEGLFDTPATGGVR